MCTLSRYHDPPPSDGSPVGDRSIEHPSIVVLSQRLKLRWLLILCVMATLAVTSVFLRVRGEAADHALNQWLDHAREHGISPTLSIDCDVPGLKSNSLALQLFGRFRVHVTARFTEDAVRILELPDCPVPLIVSAWRHVSEEHAERLKRRFGSENVRS